MAIPIVLDWDQYIYDKLLTHDLVISTDVLTNSMMFRFNDESISQIPVETYQNEYRWLIDEVDRQCKARDAEREARLREQEEQEEVPFEMETGEHSEGVC